MNRRMEAKEFYQELTLQVAFPSQQSQRLESSDHSHGC